MLRDRDTPRFLFESLQLFGGVGDDLLHLATDLLTQLSARNKPDNAHNLNADAFAEQVEAACAFYRQSCPEFKARARVTNDVSGLIVSRGMLLINSDLILPPSRVEALLAHEVGTHLLTYYNVTTRVYRGGGFTKDAVYLRGFEAILRYVQADGDLNPLLVGKMAVEHIPIIKELQYRKVLEPAPVAPRYMQDSAARERLERLRGGNGTVVDGAFARTVPPGHYTSTRFLDALQQKVQYVKYYGRNFDNVDLCTL